MGSLDLNDDSDTSDEEKDDEDESDEENSDDGDKDDSTEEELIYEDDEEELEFEEDEEDEEEGSDESVEKQTLKNNLKITSKLDKRKTKEISTFKPENVESKKVPFKKIFINQIITFHLLHLHRLMNMKKIPLMKRYGNLHPNNNASYYVFLLF